MRLFEARGPGTLVGCWVKTASPTVVEVLGRSGAPFAVLDAEHAPFGPAEIDACLLAARATGMPLLVRIPEIGSALGPGALDAGAAGVMCPHVRTADDVTSLVAASKYVHGRSASASGRAGGYGAVPLAQHMQRSDAHTIVIAQIEDADAVACAAEIAVVDGLDAIFVGTVDLSVSLGVDGPAHPDVSAAVETIVERAHAAGRTVGAYPSCAEHAAHLRALGVDWFVAGSDQAFLRAGVASLSDFAAPQIEA